MRFSEWSSDVCSSDLRISNGIPVVRAVSGDRSGGVEPVDVDGHDDALADDHLTAVQGDVVRTGGWLVVADRHSRRQFLRLVWSERRSEERRVGKECVSGVDIGGCGVITKKKKR